MKRVLIVDDELLVRVGLKTTIPWEDHGYKLVGDAKNGKEAIDLITEKKPDIILTDISMPFMDGLELIRLIRKNYAQMKFIILSHHDDFKFAQQAISLGVIQYILKHELTAENLLTALNNASNDMPVEQFLLADNNKLLEVSVENETNSNAEMEKVLLNNQFYLNNDFYIIVSVHINEDFVESKKITLQFIKNLALEFLSDLPFKSFVNFNEKEIIFLLNLKKQTTIQTIKKIMQSVNENVKKILDVNLLIGISEKGNKKEEFKELYIQSQRAKEQSYFSRKNVMVYQKESDYGYDEKILFDNDLLESLVVSGCIRQVEKLLTELFQQIELSKNFNKLECVYSELLRLFNKLSSKKIEQEIGNFSAFVEVQRFILEQYISLSNKYIGGTERYSIHIQKSLSYINKYYSTDLSLAMLANFLEINKSYLSSLFKQELGINFTSYLTKVRIEKAKELLTQTDFKMYEIADQIGFDNPYYFSKVFRDLTGVNCKEYRKSHYKKE
ncbi:response regulator [Halalkalibacter flavus]|uniref:response regulator n=1 Tax=Halalkalibacter flavus TaxID=3090668 RepID=UPI002FCC2C35